MIIGKPKARKSWNVAHGIKTVRDKITGELREICVTSAAKEKRRREIFDAAEERCEKCGRKLDFDAELFARNAMHWHHVEIKGMGGAWTDDRRLDSKGNIIGRALCSGCHLQDEHHQF